MSKQQFTLGEKAVLAVLAAALLGGCADVDAAQEDASTAELQLNSGGAPTNAAQLATFGPATMQSTGTGSSFLFSSSYVREIDIPYARQLPDPSTPGQGWCSGRKIWDLPVLFRDHQPCDWSQEFGGLQYKWSYFEPSNPEGRIRWPNLSESFRMFIKQHVKELLPLQFTVVELVGGLNLSIPPNSTQVIARIPGLFTPLGIGLVRGTVAFGILSCHGYGNDCENLSVVGVLQTSQDGVTWTDVASVSKRLSNDVTEYNHQDRLEVSRSFFAATMVQLEVRLVRGAEAASRIPLSNFYLTEVRLAGEECVPDASDPSRCL